MKNYKPFYSRSLNGGTQDVYKFENGYGASVINSPMSYGQELAVINKFKSKGFELCYTTEITDDVMGHLSDDEVQEILKKIKDLNDKKLQIPYKPLLTKRK